MGGSGAHTHRGIYIIIRSVTYMISYTGGPCLCKTDEHLGLGEKKCPAKALYSLPKQGLEEK